MTNEKYLGYFNRLPAIQQENFRELCALAGLPGQIKLTDEGAKLIKCFEKIRHNTGYHYWDAGPNLASGFRYHFFESNRGYKQNQFAYYSLSRPKFSETRFFYVDAAIAGYLEKCAQDVGNRNIEEISELVINFAGRTAQVISRLLEIYLDEKPNI